MRNLRRIRFETKLLAIIVLLSISCSTNSCLAQKKSPVALAQKNSGFHVRDCGFYCLIVALNALEGEGITVDQVRKSIGPTPPTGFTLDDIAKTANELGFQTRGVKTTLGYLRVRNEDFVCIVPVANEHFLIFSSFLEDGVRVVDPPFSRFRRNVDIDEIWQGNALLISNNRIPSEFWIRLSWWALRIGSALALVSAVFFGGKFAVNRLRRTS